MGSGGVAIAALPTVICLKVPFSDGLGGGKINVCHNACLLIINKVFAMTKVHLFFVNNKHFAFFMGIFLSTSALCYYLRLHAHFSI